MSKIFNEWYQGMSASNRCNVWWDEEGDSWKISGKYDYDSAWATREELVTMAKAILENLDGHEKHEYIPVIHSGIQCRICGEEKATIE